VNRKLHVINTQYSNKVMHKVRSMKQLTGRATPREQRKGDGPRRLSEAGARNYANWTRHPLMKV